MYVMQIIFENCCVFMWLLLNELNVPCYCVWSTFVIIFKVIKNCCINVGDIIMKWINKQITLFKISAILWLKL